MMVLGVNKILGWCQIIARGRKYTCRTKTIDGKLCFIFKKVWHPIADYISDNCDELVQIDGKVYSRPFKE